MPVEPPPNGEYLAAAYVVTVVILLGYWARLWRRARKSVNGENYGRNYNVSGEERT